MEIITQMKQLIVEVQETNMRTSHDYEKLTLHIHTNMKH